MDFVKNHAFIYKHFSLLNNKYFEETMSPKLQCTDIY